MRGDKNVSVTITTGTILTTLLIGLLVVVLYFLRDLVLIVLTAIVISSAIEPAILWFERRGLPRIAGVLTTYLGIIAVMIGLFYILLPPLIGEARSFLTSLPETFVSIDPSLSLSEKLGFGGGFVGEGMSLADLVTSLEGLFSGTAGGALQAAASVFGGIVSLLLVIVLSFYFAIQSTGIDDFLRVITPISHQNYVVGLWRRSQVKIGLWMQGQLVLSLLAAIFVFLGLSILGVRYAFLLAITAGVLELIPVFGSIIAAVPAIAIAYIQGDVTLMVIVLILYVVVNQLQSHLFYPLVVKQIIGLPPVVVILALIAGAQLAGFLGIILSVPVAAALQEFISDIQKYRLKNANGSA